MTWNFAAPGIGILSLSRNDRRLGEEWVGLSEDLVLYGLKMLFLELRSCSALFVRLGGDMVA